MKLRYTKALLITVFFCLCIINLVYTSEASGFERPLRTVKADAAEVKGSFTVIFYGGRFSDDMETIAILDPEGDPYHFEPFAPDFDYKIKKGLQAKEAFAEAQKFISFHPAFWRSQMSKILDNKGNTRAYELRPLYLHFVYGISDVLEVNYWLKEDGKVKVTIRLIPAIERAIKFPGGDGGSGGGGGN